MNATRMLATTLSVTACLLVHRPQAQAIEFDGAWVNPESNCSKVFIKRRSGISFSRRTDLHGSGFVIEGNRITGRIARCTIRSRKEDGDVLHFHTTCSTDIALQDVQFSVKPDGDDKITRIFSGLPELDRTYYRCSFH